MSTIAETKEAVDRLAPREYCQLMSALHRFKDDDRDGRMEVDDAAGKYAAMNERAEREHAAGRTRLLSGMIEDRA